MNDELYVSRNQALVFALYTRENLEFIERASKEDENSVHVVTQIANSLLGLVVFIWEKEFVKHTKELQLDELAKDGWPRFEILKGECSTLHQLVRHLRNAVAHGRIRFSSDNRDPNSVMIDIEDGKINQPPNWSARMKASDLREFCLKFAQLVQDAIG
jgi:signal transduction histidine kinase